MGHHTLQNALSFSLFYIDDSILDKLAEFGYPREAVIHCLNKNELNNATTAYWLIQMAHQMEASEEAAANAAEKS